MYASEPLRSSSMNFSAVSTADCFSYSDYEDARIAKVVATFLIAFLAVLGNSMIIYIVFSEPRSTRKNINYFIANAATADLLLTLVHAPTQYIAPLLLKSFSWAPQGLTGHWTCKIISYCIDVPLLVSPLSMFFISIERYRATISFIRTTGMSRAGRMTSIALTWGLSGAVCLPILYYVESVPSADGSSYCIWMTSPLPKWYILLIIFTSGLEGSAVVVINTLTVKRLHNSVIPLSVGAGQRKRRESRIKNAVRMVLCSVITYSVLVSPFYLYYCIFHLNNVIVTKACALRRTLRFLFSFLLYANAALGPFIYLGFIHEFRARLRGILLRGNERVFLMSTRVVSLRGKQSTSEATVT